MPICISTKDIDELLELFRQLEELLNPELPEKNKGLWEESQALAKKELAEQLKERQSGFTVRSSQNVSLRKTSKANQKEIQQQCEKRIYQIAEKKYYEKDPIYARALEEAKTKALDVCKSIDHLLLAVREPLLQFPRVQSSLLAVDWKEHIRDYYSFINKDNFSYQVRETIDVLEALKVQFERKRSKENESQQDQKLAETEQKAWSSIRKRIWASVKKIPRWIYYTLGALAALLTIFHYLGWI
jgi:hypothetical protein